jgi:2-methylcitrate dehydratase
MTQVEQLASFVVKSLYEDLPDPVRQALKIRILDALGCAIGAVDGEPIRIIRAGVDEFGGSELCTLIGGGRTAPDRAAFYNSALVRYIDFNDSFLAPQETCHPSDNLGAVLAAVEYAGCGGRDLLVALAVAYQVQCRLSLVAPVRAKGFDHTTQGAYAAAAGISRALGLDQTRTSHAIAISGTAFNALRVTRTGSLSHWKGLAYPNTAFGATHAAFLAKNGITGPLGVFEGNKGFMDAISGPFTVDWAHEDFSLVLRTIVKRYNAEIHSQSAIEGILELKHQHHFDARDIESIDIGIFDVAYNIIGGGEEGDKKTVRTKEQADHSLPYMIAVALLDDQVMPPQYDPARIIRPDVQTLLRKISISPVAEFSRRFPDEMPCRLTVRLTDGRTLSTEKNDYEGFHTRPMRWDTVARKFKQVSAPAADSMLQDEIIALVADLEDVPVSALMALLSRVGAPSRTP